MSQDYFLTADVLLGSTTDQVFPFARADGSIEALVLENGTLSYLAADPTSPSGWTYTQLTFPTTMNHIDQVVVGLNSDGTVYGMCAAAGTGTTPSLATMGFTLSTDGTWSPRVGTGGTIRTPLLRVGWTSQGEVYFYATSKDLGLVYAWRPAQAWAKKTIKVPGLPNDALLLWEPTTNIQGITPGVLSVDDDNTVWWLPQNSDGSYGAPQNTGGIAAQLVWIDWAYDAAQSGITRPAYTFLGTDGSIQRSFQLMPPAAVPTDGIGTLDPQISVWNTLGALSFGLVDTDSGTLNIVTQNGPGDILTYPIPIQADVEAVYALPRDADQATMFVVSSAATLSVLSRDKTSNEWSRTPVVAPAATVQDLNNWRVQLTVMDANNLPVPGQGLQVTPVGSAVGVWQPTGSTALAAGVATTFTTNTHGQVTFAVPALELQAVPLSVQLLDGNGAPSGSPITVNPDGNVHDFLAGTSSLPQQGQLTGSTLMSATCPMDGKPLSDTLTNQPTASTAVATAVNNCMAAGQGQTPDQVGTSSFSLDLSGATPTYAEGSSTVAIRQPVGSASDWWDKVKHDVDSVGHAIRHGLMKVTHCVVEWVKDEATNAFNWVVTLALDVAHWGAQVAQFVIDGVKTAIHAIHGIFNAIGAAIERVINWIRMALDGLIQHAEANAQTMLTLLRSAPAALGSQIGNLSNMTNGFFSTLEDKANAQLASVASNLGAGTTFNNLGPGSSTSSVSRRPTPTGGLGVDASTILTSVTHNWLLEKILSVFSDSSGGTSDTLTDGLNKLVGDVEGLGEGFVKELGGDLWDGIKDTISHPSDFEKIAVGTLMTALSAGVTDALKLGDAIVVDLLQLLQDFLDEFGDILDTEIDSVPLIGGVLSHLGIGVPKTTVGHLFCLIVMFPTTFAYQLAHDGHGSLFPALPSSGAVSDTADWGPGLEYTHGVVRIIGGPIAALGDFERLYNLTAPVPPPWFGYFGGILGCIISICTWPGTKVNGVTPAPFTTPPDVTGMTNEIAAAQLLVGWTQPILTVALAACNAQKADAGLIDAFGVVTFALALAAVGLGEYVDTARDVEHTNPKLYAAKLIERIPGTLSPLATKALEEMTGGWSIAGKLVCDLVFNITAGALYVDLAAT